MFRNNARAILAAPVVALVASVVMSTGSSSAAADQPSTTVVGGEPVAEAVSWVGSLGTADGRPRCGATLIASQWMLTAAHCVTNPPPTTEATGKIGPAASALLGWHSNEGTAHLSEFRVRVGSLDRTTGGQLRSVVAVHPHPEWSWGIGGDRVADIALLRLNKPVAGPFALPWRASDERSVRVMGWGFTTQPPASLPLTLHEIDLPIVPDSECGATAGELCVGLPDDQEGGPCYGDSGGPGFQPMRTGWPLLVGITSRGVTPVCGAGPSAFTDPSAYKRWITHTILKAELGSGPTGPNSTR